MGLLRRSGNGQGNAQVPQTRTVQPPQPAQPPQQAPNAPELYEQLAETAHTRFIYPSDPIVDRMLIALGAEPIFDNGHTFQRQGYGNIGFRAFTLPSTLHIEIGRPSKPDEFPDGVTGFIPIVLRSSDGLIFAALDISSQKCKIQLGTTWNAMHEFFSETTDIPPLSDLIANAGFSQTPQEPSERHLRFHVDGASIMGTMSHIELAQKKLGSGYSQKDFDALVTELRKPFVEIGNQRVGLLRTFMAAQAPEETLLNATESNVSAPHAFESR